MAKLQPKSRVGETLLTIALGIYVCVLMVAAVDELFDVGIFPPELERDIAVWIKELRHEDQKVQARAEDKLANDGHQFAIRQLINELRDPDPKFRDRVAAILATICAELDLEAQAEQAVKRLGSPDPETADEAQWELVEIGHWGVPAILDAMGRRDPAVKDRLRRALVQATSMYFDDDPLEAIWNAEKLDARAALLVRQLANPKLADAAAAELKTIPHFAMPQLLNGLRDPQTWPKATHVLAEIAHPELDPKAALLVAQMADPTKADAAAEEFKKMPDAAVPRLIAALWEDATRPKVAQVLADITKQNPQVIAAQWPVWGIQWWETWYTQWWDNWLKREKGKLGFGTNYKQWKLWYRMNKDHL